MAICLLLSSGIISGVPVYEILFILPEYFRKTERPIAKALSGEGKNFLHPESRDQTLYTSVNSCTKNII